MAARMPSANANQRECQPTRMPTNANANQRECQQRECQPTRILTRTSIQIQHECWHKCQREHQCEFNENPTRTQQESNTNASANASANAYYGSSGCLPLPLTTAGPAAWQLQRHTYI